MLAGGNEIIVKHFVDYLRHYGMLSGKQNFDNKVAITACWKLQKWHLLLTADYHITRVSRRQLLSNGIAASKLRHQQVGSTRKNLIRQCVTGSRVHKRPIVSVVSTS